MTVKIKIPFLILVVGVFAACNPSRDLTRPSKAILGCWVGIEGGARPYFFSDKYFTFRRALPYSDEHPQVHLPYKVIQETTQPFTITLEIPSLKDGPLRYTYQFSADRNSMTCDQYSVPALGKSFPGPGTLHYRANVAYLD